MLIRYNLLVKFRINAQIIVVGLYLAASRPWISLKPDFVLICRLHTITNMLIVMTPYVHASEMHFNDTLSGSCIFSASVYLWQSLGQRALLIAQSHNLLLFCDPLRMLNISHPSPCQLRAIYGTTTLYNQCFPFPSAHLWWWKNLKKKKPANHVILLRNLWLNTQVVSPLRLI